MLDFDFSKEIDSFKQTLICAKCKKVVQNPRHLTTCRHIACKACLQPQGTPCPQCHASFGSQDIEKCDVFIEKALAFIAKMENRFQSPGNSYTIEGISIDFLHGNRNAGIIMEKKNIDEITANIQQKPNNVDKILIDTPHKHVDVKPSTDIEKKKNYGKKITSGINVENKTIETSCNIQNRNIKKIPLAKRDGAPKKQLDILPKHRKGELVSSKIFYETTEGDSSSFFETNLNSEKMLSIRTNDKDSSDFQQNNSNNGNHLAKFVERNHVNQEVKPKNCTVAKDFPNFIMKNKNIEALSKHNKNTPTTLDCSALTVPLKRISTSRYSNKNFNDDKTNKVINTKTKSKEKHCDGVAPGCNSRINRTMKDAKDITNNKNDIDKSIRKWFARKEYVCMEIGQNKLKTIETVMKRNPKGETPLHVACKKGQTETAIQLISVGVDINATDWANWTPLHEAVQSCSVSCVELLLAEGALVNVPAQKYRTPLHEAVDLGHVVITELLLMYGGDKTAPDYAGKTAADLCMLKELSEVMSGNNRVRIDKIPDLYIKVGKEVYTANVSCKCVNFLHTNKWNCNKSMVGKDIMLCVIGSGINLYSPIVMHMILRGIMTVRESDMEKYESTALPIQPDLIPPQIHPALIKSIINRLHKNPSLFDGMNFHIVGHSKPVTIKDAEFTKNDLSALIKAGGGKLLVRAPAERTVEDELLRPYHCRQSEKLCQCSNYIIYDERDPPMLLYNMLELRHFSSNWLITCIYNFKIDV